jgi:hypothetical protein
VWSAKYLPITSKKRNYNQSNLNEIHIKEINPIQYNTGMMIESKDQNAMRREYYQNNKDKFMEYCQTYRNKNMDKCREYAKSYYHEKIKSQPLVICECGQGVRQASMSKHIKSKRHFAHLDLMPKV